MARYPKKNKIDLIIKNIYNGTNDIFWSIPPVTFYSAVSGIKTQAA
jgi:hypothetical protein